MSRVPSPPAGVTAIWGRRVPPPERILLLRHSYYELMRQTRLALLSFDYSSRLRSPCRLLPAPAASGLFPTLALRIFPMMPGPLSRRLADCSYLVLPLPQRPSPTENGSAYRNIPLKRLHKRGGFSRLQPFLYVQASQFARHPDRSYHDGFPQGSW